MLDFPADQAAGLRGLAPPTGPHLVAMVSHGDDQTELPLLWRLCSALVSLGYAVTVLDATKRESEANPGLSQHLEYNFRHKEEEQDAPGWSVIPSALGIQNLSAETTLPVQRLQRLAPISSPNGVVILYAKAEWLALLLVDSGVTPLLAVSSVKNSLLTSYLALKRLLLNARLAPTILNMMGERQSSATANPANVTSHLSDCARNFLGYEVNALNIDLCADETRLDAAMRRLSTHLLETAIPLSFPRSRGAYQARTQPADRFARAF
ncbi:hypothetical protein [Rhodoferax saidenbachensis]|uniref:Uncharacterized protein n=1 Tax=Rhodoferax saidenbachensis TaxID=1484693 RepID=A0A1P8K6D9_9BURK|nr:hypothetical protein [Rhodoferax saidenbachensis]APW41578.1 hypothetical protein RS694_02755 [Rhodoferax saidenbachensis]